MNQKNANNLYDAYFHYYKFEISKKYDMITIMYMIP